MELLVVFSGTSIHFPTRTCYPHGPQAWICPLIFDGKLLSCPGGSPEETKAKMSQCSLELEFVLNVELSISEEGKVAASDMCGFCSAI